ncbi:MAG: RagB/SusD domain protein [Bacteroidetes bacterium]|nr:RagB/SusD domain protein [Bacteroidota bacterium]
MNVKHNKIKFTILSILISLGLSSCVNDLNVTPIDPSTIQTFDQDAVFAKTYSSLALTGQQGPAGKGDLAGVDEGTSSFIRLIWNLNEMSTDEAICSWGDPGIPELNFNKWTSSHDQVNGIYARFYFGVSLCNLFLEQTASLTDAKTIKQRAEVRFLRALNYYYLMDLFGNVPFTEVVSLDPPKQIKRADLFAWLEAELKAIDADLSTPRSGSYYRVDQAAEWLLLARMYLNAQVYTGTARWADAKTYAKKVMDSSYKLNPSYAQLFMADNAGTFDGSTNTAPQEIILPVACDGVNTKSWGNSLFLIASTHTSGMPAWGSTEGWGGNRARAALGKKFFPNGIPAGTDLTKLTAFAGDKRAMFFGWDIADSKSTDPMTILNPGIFKQGLSVAKYSNVRADGKATSDKQYTDTDVPLLRVAEAYLTYAEASIRLGDATTALTTINLLRDRTSTSAPALTSITLEKVLDEWSREFYFEGRRRIDLIRFGCFGGSDYTWDWKGGSAAGTKFGAIYNLYPIPANDMNLNPNLEQNPGF